MAFHKEEDRKRIEAEKAAEAERQRAQRRRREALADFTPDDKNFLRSMKLL